MPDTEIDPVSDLEVGRFWRELVRAWAAGSGLGCVADRDGGSLSVAFELPDTDQPVTARFMATAELLVAFMTDGHVLKPDQLAVAAAASNAWNTEQLIPMLSVWDVRGPSPCLAGVCVLPLSCRMSQRDFAALGVTWADHARQMFTRCHRVFGL